MAAKVVFFVCALALMLESISGQCCRAAPTAARWAPPSGGSLPVSSASPNSPSGVALQSENSYSGDISICGAMPFLGTVGLEGCLPTAGYSAVQYGCGCGDVAILSENAAPTYAPHGCARAY